MNACFALTEAGGITLLDCGATALVAMRRWGVDPDRIGTIAISHLHGDHFGGLVTLGTDGFGRSESRQVLRRHFEIDAEHTAFLTLGELHRRGAIDAKTLLAARESLGIDPSKIDPAIA